MPDHSDLSLPSLPATQNINPVHRWLRLEGLAAFIVALLVYAHLHASWWMFAILFLVPDISMVGYLLGPRIGALAYNLFHTYTVPAALAIVMHFSKHSFSLPAIWVAHIGFDRAMGYGLKYKTGFNHTHLGLIGRAASAVNEKERH
jgi:hypothetical protein